MYHILASLKVPLNKTPTRYMPLKSQEVLFCLLWYCSGAALVLLWCCSAAAFAVLVLVGAA